MSSKSQRKSITLYLDRNLGTQIVPSLLQKHKIKFEIHDCHLASDAPDEEWIELCSTNGWIAITKDARLIRDNRHAICAIKNSIVGVFVITGGNMTGEELGNLIVDSYRKIEKLCDRTTKPFVAKISRQGRVNKVKLPR